MTDAVRRTYEIPEFYCPFPLRFHPQMEEVEAGHKAWLERFGYFETDKMRHHVVDMATWELASATVNSGNVEAVQLCASLLAWYLAIDDDTEESGRTGDPLVGAKNLLHCVRIFNNPDDLPEQPTYQHLALQDMVRRLRLLGTFEQWRRFVHSSIQYFAGALAEAAYVADGTALPMGNYHLVRGWTTVTSGFLVFSEIADGFNATEAMWRSPALWQATMDAQKILALHHDVLSGFREFEYSVTLNYPALIARDHAVSHNEGVRRTTEQADKRTASFIESTDRLISEEDDPVVEAYVDALKRWIRGNLYWTSTCQRYHVDSFRAG